MKEYKGAVAAIEKGQDVLVLIVRGGVTQYITVPAPAAK
jgi:hypothetical protein